MFVIPSFITRPRVLLRFVLFRSRKIKDGITAGGEEKRPLLGVETKYQKREREKMAIVVSRSFFFEYFCSDLCAFSFSLLLYPPPIRTRAFSSSLSRSVLLAPFLTGSRTRRRSLIVFFFFLSPFLSFFFIVRSKVTPRSSTNRNVHA